MKASSSPSVVAKPWLSLGALEKGCQLSRRGGGGGGGFVGGVSTAKELAEFGIKVFIHCDLHS